MPALGFLPPRQPCQGAGAAQRPQCPWLGGFCLEQEGMPGTSSAMGTSRHTGELAAGCKG